jgi:2-polyprenyl-3-methyl-5-hydroxy-6-metoxy-1,4-benzoquinol methylase
MTSLFIRPPLYTLDGYKYMSAANSYTEYNYLKSGIASLLRRRHFEYALQLTKSYFHKCNVIDFGCADAPFLPSLSKYFNYVVGIDEWPDFVALASKISPNYVNTEIIDNKDMSMDELRLKLSRQYHILFLLETIEHIGDKDNPWKSRVDFIDSLFKLIDKDGIIVMSVPNMVGLPFLLQRVGLFLTGAKRGKLSASELVKAVLFNDTITLEKRWYDGTHLGFNHMKLEPYLKEKFNIIEKKDILFQVIYVMSRRNVDK